MKLQSLKEHLKPYGIVSRRKTTINHAFASAIAPFDEFSAEEAKRVLSLLGLDPENIACIYCGGVAETWDHLEATVKKSEFSGHGHCYGNLAPACKPCNSKRGNKPVRTFVESRGLVDSNELTGRISAYQQAYACPHVTLEEIKSASPQEYEEYMAIKDDVLKLLARADELAGSIRVNANSILLEKRRVATRS